MIFRLLKPNTSERDYACNTLATFPARMLCVPRIPIRAWGECGSIIVIQHLGVYFRIETPSLVQEATMMDSERLMLYRMRF
jgi:hypothetical protein